MENTQTIPIVFQGIPGLTPPIDTTWILEPAEERFIAELGEVIRRIYGIVPDKILLQPFTAPSGQKRLTLRLEVHDSFHAIKLAYNNRLMLEFAIALHQLVGTWNRQSPSAYYHNLRGTAILQQMLAQDENCAANEPDSSP